jgi:hypothetical protein
MLSVGAMEKRLEIKKLRRKSKSARMIGVDGKRGKPPLFGNTVQVKRRRIIPVLRREDLIVSKLR